MNMISDIKPDKGQFKECKINDRSVSYILYENIVYCEKPKSDIQKMHLFVPSVYMNGGTINGYDYHSAPILMPNTVGGYMEGPADMPGLNSRTGKPNIIFEALEHGYVVCSAGVRGRNTGKETREFFEGAKAEQYETHDSVRCGRAPAFVVDMKAAVRWLRKHRDIIPGNTEYIITNGTSAGGALSALMGASGNCEEYEPYLEDIGACKEDDSIFAASCYCPIHNLEHADAAYEWQFNQEHSYTRTRRIRTDKGLVKTEENGDLNEQELQMSDELKKQFTAYLNSLDLKDDGRALTLEEDGTGSFLDYIISQLEKSFAQEEKYREIAVEQSRPDHMTCMHGDTLDWSAYIKDITRMKTVPAFDAVDLRSPENEEFGDENVEARHFTRFSFEKGGGEMADENLIRIMNPVSMMETGTLAKHWRIRHGSFDRDTSLAIPVILERKLAGLHVDVDFALPWGLPHAGDYDIEELFCWIDEKVKEVKS